MKTKKTNLLKATGKITVLAIILAVTACTNNEGTKTEKNTAAKTDVKPPKIDIHTAVLTDNMEALKQHIAAGTNINEKDPMGGSSPLITAALFGKTEAARILIEAGADINFKNNDASTALHTAAFFCRPEIVKILLAKGADKNIKNKYGSTAYDSVVIPFATAKPTYDMMGKMLAPMGLKMDYAYMEKTRPEIAAMLK